jgi:methyl-accepting chemotaxis protein
LGTEAIREITAIIGRMNEIGSIIAGAVRDQSGATQEIVQSAQQAADGTRTVSRSIEVCAMARARRARPLPMSMERRRRSRIRPATFAQ